MKVALVHDWLTGYRGGEKCLDAFLQIFPEADVFTLIHVPGTTSPAIDKAVVRTSWLQSIPAIEKHYRYYLPFFPLALRSFSFEGYDLIISLSHAAVKNIQVPEGVPHICYCFTPMRYIWDQAPFYFGRKEPFLYPLLESLRRWDRKGSEGVTRFVAISNFVAARIRCFYQRRSEVIFPPVDTSWITPRREGEAGQAFLYAGALVPYKRPDLLIDAFKHLNEELWIAGSGPMEEALKERAGPNVHFLGKVSNEELASCYRNCRALLFPGKEDFGMVPVECLAAGRPVIGLGDGGLLDTVNGISYRKHVDGPLKNINGVFIPAQEAGNLESLVASIKFFIQHESEISREACVTGAAEFAPDRFFERLQLLLADSTNGKKKKQYA